MLRLERAMRRGGDAIISSRMFQRNTEAMSARPTSYQDISLTRHGVDKVGSGAETGWTRAVLGVGSWCGDGGRGRTRCTWPRKMRGRRRRSSNKE